MKSIAAALLAALLAACSGEPAATNAGAVANDAAPAPAPAAPAPSPSAEPAGDATGPGEAEAPGEAAYLGRWTGVEGMVLDVAAKPGGGVTMDMQWDLDNRGRFDGSVTAEGLRFVRNGVAETAVRTDGNATGLKYLAGKTDCLTVKPGEGYCR